MLLLTILHVYVLGPYPRFEVEGGFLENLLPTCNVWIYNLSTKWNPNTGEFTVDIFIPVQDGKISLHLVMWVVKCNVLVMVYIEHIVEALHIICIHGKHIMFCIFVNSSLHNDNFKDFLSFLTLDDNHGGLVVDIPFAL